MIVYVLVKGAPLTKAEFDGNFHDLDDRVTNIEDNPPEARSIEDIIAVGNSLIVQYNDSTEDGPFPLPTVTLRGRGDWAPFTVYLANDAVQHAGVVYVVPTAHTSAATFDPGANDGEGHDFYSPLFDLPALSLPVGGGTGYVLAKVSGTDFDFQWVNSAVRAGGDIGDVLTKSSSADYDYDWQNAGSLTSAAVTDNPLTTLQITDENFANKYLRCTNDAGCTITIMADDIGLTFPTSTEIHFRQCGAGAVTLQGESNSEGDVILNTISGYLTQTAVLGAVITAKKVSTNEWDVWGLLETEATD